MKNLLIVIADSLRYDDGSAAFGWMRTSGGVEYTNAWAHGAATYPSFPSLWTGLDVHEHGATHRPLRPLQPTLTDRLRDLGYNVLARTENLLCSWAMPLINPDPHQQWGETVDTLLRHVPPSPWAVIYHSMITHWPYKFTVDQVELPIGWPREHPEIDPEQYHIAYRCGVDVLAVACAQLFNGIEPDVAILTADHGEAFMEHGTYLHRSWQLQPEQLRVPLFVYDGGRSYTDRGLLGLKRFPDIVMAAAEGKRIRARDSEVLAQDYHAQDLTLDDVQAPTPPLLATIRGDGAIKRSTPKFQVAEAADAVEDDADSYIVMERLRALGYA